MQEFCNGGSLRQALEGGALTCTALSHRWLVTTELLCGIAAGMEGMHQHRICHGNLNAGAVHLQVPLASALPRRLPAFCLRFAMSFQFAVCKVGLMCAWCHAQACGKRVGECSSMPRRTPQYGRHSTRTLSCPRSLAARLPCGCTHMQLQTPGGRGRTRRLR